MRVCVCVDIYREGWCGYRCCIVCVGGGCGYRGGQWRRCSRRLINDAYVFIDHERRLQLYGSIIDSIIVAEICVADADIHCWS